MGHDVAKPRRPHEAAGQALVDDTGLLQAAEGISVAGGRSQAESQAGAHGQVDHDLRRLPQMQDDGIGGVGGWLEVFSVLGQSRRDAGQVALDRHDTLGEDRLLDEGHGRRLESMAS